MKLLRWRARSTGSAPPVAPGPTPAAGPQALTLQDLVLLKVTLSWQEAVSIVLETLGGLGDRSRFPDPAGVTLSDIGETHTAGAAAAVGHPVSAAALLLKELLSGTAVPAELRALIEQNVTAPRHGTLDAFEQALAYFERPGRRGDVAAVYGRAHALYAKAIADLELERLRAKAVRDHDRAAPKAADGPAWQKRALQAVLVGGLCIVIAAGVVTMFTMAFAPAPAADDAGEPLEVTSTASTLAAAGNEAKRLVTEGLRRVLSSPSAADGTGTPDPARATAPRRGGRPSPGPASASPAPAATSGTVVTAADTTGAASAKPTDSPVEMVVSVRDVTSSMPSHLDVATLDTVETIDAAPVFTASSEDVQPAALVRPQLPTRVTDAAPDPDASILELVVDETGRVAFVRLESTQSRVSEKMLVSAAKAWVFRPALREGRPVRYRMRVRISEQ